MYGVVYRDQEGVPQLLVVGKDSVSVGAIDDDENVYKSLPEDCGEIVYVEQNDAARIVGLRNLCGLTLHKYGVRFTKFYEGVNTILNDEPSELAALVLDNAVKHGQFMAQAQAEGAEVLIWPDGTFMFSHDYRHQQWEHLGSEFERRWCSPNYLRKIGLLC